MNTAKPPTISIIVNTTDRAKPLANLLHALEHQSYPHFELIVVVGPTKDETLDVLAPYGQRVQVLRCDQANLSQSRNIGLLAARGDIVAYIDDDAVPSYRWLEQLARLFGDALLAGTGGMVYLVHPANSVVQHRLGTVSSLAEQTDTRNSWLEQLVPPGHGKQWAGRMMGTNMAYRRRDLLEVGGFDQFFEWLYDDTDIAMRLVNAGKIIHPVKEAVVYHVPASSRNRQARSFNARWWVQTKSVIYFALKYGPEAGESRREIALRCLHYVHGHLLWAQQLRQLGHLTTRQLWKMRREEIKSAVIGVYHGLMTPRQTLSKSDLSMTNANATEIRPFPTPASAQQPTVDPVSGRRPSITLPDEPLRLCLLSAAYPPDQYEGVGRLTNLMAQGLFEIGHTVHVITRGPQDTVSFYDGAYVHKIPSPDRYGRYRMFPKLYHSLNHSHAVHEKVKRLILNDGIQLVDSPLWQYDGLVTAVSGEIPVVVRLVTALRQIAAMQDDVDADARLVGEMEQTLLEKATYLLPNTQATMDTAQKVYGIQPDPNRYRLVPYGIVPVSDEAVRPFTPHNPPPTFTVLYLGRLEKRKGIQDLFAAIPQVLAKVANVQFIIAGADNSHRDGFQQQTGLTYAAYFQQQYAQFASHVSFLGQVSEEKLNQLYQTCDLFVAPSLYESFGLIYLEAMNYGKPVIGCRAGGIPEVIDEGLTGLLAEPEAPDSLAEAILNMLQNPSRLREMGLAGRQRLLDTFTHVQMARRFADAYRHVIYKNY
ncbi:MAG: glycosyltransferase [Candidatus Promineifilaceae bacterium]|nr:glycosyltransferase [Anaerolineaceae bacterium]